MVHEGFQRYGGVEVVNTERLAAYVANGIVPAGAQIDVPAIADGLADVVTTDLPYTTPLQDMAPWVDVDDADSFDFAGVLPLALTGADNTTRTVDMIATTRDVALPGSARRGARTLAASALLVGKTTESVQVGLAWLTRALHGACDDVELTCGPAATLELFTANPGPIVPAPDTSVPPVTTQRVHPTDTENPSYGWVVVDGSFDTDTGDATRLIPFAPEPIDAELSDSYVPAIIDGGGADPVGDLIDAGDAGPLGSETLLSADGSTCTTGPVMITWRLRRATDAATDVQLVIVDDSGAAVEFGPKYDLTDDLAAYEWELPFGVAHDTWRPGIVVSYATDVADVVFSSYTDSSPLACVAPYWRFFPQTVVTSGPTPVETIDTGCAVLMRVEWVWVSGSPYRYGTSTTVLDGLSADNDPTLVLPGVSWFRQTGDAAPVVVDNCDTATGWSANHAASLYATGTGQIQVFGLEFAPVVSRLGNIDVSTNRFITIDWRTPGTPVYLPGLSVRDTLGATANATLLATTAGDDGYNHSVFSVPGSIGDTINRLSWFQTDDEVPYISIVFNRITTQSVAAPESATVAATPWNCSPPAPASTCAVDPCAPGFLVPPSLPYIADPARPRITTQQVHSMWACIGPEQTPANDGVFNIALAASDGPIVGARVRVWDDAAGDCTVLDNCAFAYEYLIDYVPDDGVLTINGRDGTFTTLCDGGNVLADASGVVAGDFGGPTKEPAARCNRRYFVLVQWLATYPRTCEGVYETGNPQGDVTLTVSVTPREG